MAAENILIDFQVDYSQLDAALDMLEKTGAVDKQLAQDFKAANIEIAKQGQLAQGSVQKTGELVGVFNKVKSTATSMGKSVEKAFQEGVADALEEAGVSAEEFQAALTKAGTTGAKATTSLRQELRQLTQEIATAKASGGPVDPAMIQRAGELKDAIADANAEIANAGSDTRGVDNVIGSIQAMAGAFAVAQGAAALFGEENEDVQKALLKVNAALAISQGVQQLLNATQKEGALTKLADATATGLQTAAQRIYTAVTGQATAATVGFKVALAATGIGAAIVLVLALAAAFSTTKTEAEDANREIERQKDILEGLNEVISRRVARQEAEAKALGRSESELIKIRGRGIQAQIAGLDAANAKLVAQRNAVDNASEAWFTLNSQIEENNNTIGALRNEEAIAAINLTKQIADEQQAAADRARDNAEKAAADAKKRREQLLQDEIDRIQKTLIETEKGGQAEIEVRKKLLTAQAALEIAQADGNAARIALIRAKLNESQLALVKDFNLKNIQENKEASERILAILDKYIADTNEKYNSLLQAEQALADARTGVTRRALNRIAEDEQKSVDERINALSSLERYELTRIDKQIENVNKLLIPEEERNLRLAQLADEREKVIEDTEKKVTDVTLSEEDKRTKGREAAFARALEIARGVSEVFASFNDLLAEQENQRLSEQRAQLDALVEAGAITQKEADKRQKQLEVQEKQIKIRQAQRDKSLALFNAVVNGAAAVVSALARGGPILAAITGALVAAQIGIIASRPIPKFFKGKKDGYSGLGMVGEAGAELVERNGQMFIAPRKTITYLGPSDKVYTPAETKAILHNMDKPVQGQQQQAMPKFDYEKFAAAATKGQKSITINIEKDFITESVGQAIKKHYDNRYRFK